jgi:cobalt-zinc-cadmium efflux system membrane fusion protein
MSTTPSLSPMPGSPAHERPAAVIPPPLLWLGAAVVVALLGFGAWELLHPAGRGQASSVRDGIHVAGDAVAFAANTPMRRYFEIEQAAEQAALAPLPVPGRVALDERRTSAIGAPLPGRVEEVVVRVGDVVQPGAKLLSIRSGALADVQHEIDQATAQVAVKKRIVERTRALVELQTAAVKDQLAAEAELREAELALQNALARRDSLRISPAGINEFWVTAPRAGAIVELGVTPGEQVSPDRDAPLLKIADLSEVLVVADVQERDASDLRAGDVVEVRGLGGTLTRAGTVEHVSDVVDPARRTIQARVRVENGDGKLHPNAYVEVAIPAGPTPRVRVAAEAVLTDGHESVVLREDATGRLVRTPVIVGRERNGEVEILGGLGAGDRYVGRGAILVLNEIDLAE